MSNSVFACLFYGVKVTLEVQYKTVKRFDEITGELYEKKEFSHYNLCCNGKVLSERAEFYEEEDIEDLGGLDLKEIECSDTTFFLGKDIVKGAVMYGPFIENVENVWTNEENVKRRDEVKSFLNQHGIESCALYAIAHY